MSFWAWLIEHSIEIILAIIGGTATYYLVQINNHQKVSIKDSPHSTVIPVQNMTNSQINLFKEKNKEDVGILGEIPKVDVSVQEQIKKIENYLDENKPISTIVSMCLRLAIKLHMEKSKEWLSNELYGFKEYLEEDSKEGLKMRKTNKDYSYRRVESELNIQFNNKPVEKFPINLFISLPISYIEDWIDQNTKAGSDWAIMQAPPLQLMVETLKVNPDKKVPYVINVNSLKKIINELKLKLIKFSEEAKKVPEK